MNNADAGAPMGGFDPSQVAGIGATRRARVPIAPPPQPVPSQPTPAPEPADPRPLEELQAAADSALERRDGLASQRDGLSADLAELDRKIEQARATLDPAATRGLRADRARIEAEIAELGELVERATGAYGTAQQLVTGKRTIANAAELRSALLACGDAVTASNDAIERAVVALLDREDERAALIEKTAAIRAEMSDIPAQWRGFVPNVNPGYDVDTLMRFRHLERRRRLNLGL
jgi:DNA repair exonuclease SbcCD ATPase subunit